MKEKFSKENKIKAFDFILEEYFKQGFGSMTKGDIDLLFFSAINKYSSLKDKSDYSLSKILKITQTRIRNLKVKEGLKYSPIGIEEVEKIFLEKAKFARIEDDNKKISIPIYDPNVYIELENIIESNNGYVEAQLNPKIFTIRIDQFINLLISFETQKENSNVKKIQSEYLKRLKEKIKEEEKFYSKIDTSSIMSFKDLQKQILEKGVDFGLELLLSSIPGGTFAKKLVETLINNIK